MGLDKSAPFSKDPLGELTKNEYVEVKLRDNPNKKSICRELTTYASKSFIKVNNIKKGDVITVRLKEAKSL